MIKSITFLMLFVSTLALQAQKISMQINDATISKAEIEYELSKYPKGLLQNYLQQIIVVPDNDDFCGRAGAFTKQIELNGKCSDLKSTLHHELSSIFLQQYDLYVSEVMNDYYRSFLKLNGNYAYTNSVKWDKIDENSQLANHFYGSKYAMQGFENDFNVIAQSLFEDGAKVVAFMQSNPDKPISKKIQIVIDFYHKLDSSFTVSYFRNQKI